MSLHEYKESTRLHNDSPSFYALIMAAYRRADSLNAQRIEAAWPDVVIELRERYNLPGGMYPHENRDAS